MRSVLSVLAVLPIEFQQSYPLVFTGAVRNLLRRKNSHIDAFNRIFKVLSNCADVRSHLGPRNRLPVGVDDDVQRSLVCEHPPSSVTRGRRGSIVGFKLPHLRTQVVRLEGVLEAVNDLSVYRATVCRRLFFDRLFKILRNPKPKMWIVFCHDAPMTHFPLDGNDASCVIVNR